MEQQAQKILMQYWGFHAFRNPQKEIISSVLADKDTLALLPTGGGKSICFQVPALMKKGLCLVITPLIALMKDQVDQLKKRGIAATAIHSGMNLYEMDAALSNCINGTIKLLYVSPERLENRAFIDNLMQMKINLLAVDEAHCISQWGYDFRPSYLNIASVRQYLGSVPVLALTATATPEVVKDIQEKLDFSEENVFFKSFFRQNLRFSVIETEDKDKEVVRLCNRGGSGIIYVRNRRKTRELAMLLSRTKLKAAYYHAGMDQKERIAVQESWLENKTRFIVATNAFGMGIDKADVRLVIHYEPPDNLESYYQEAGRAGRDGKDSSAILLFHKQDKEVMTRRLNSSFPELKFVRQVYNTLCNHLQIPIGGGAEMSYDFILNSFAKTYEFPLLDIYNALKLLEREGYLFLNDSIGNPSQLMMICERSDLYRFQVENPRFDQLIKVILRTYTGVFTAFQRINEDEIAGMLKSKADVIQNALKYLDSLDILRYSESKQQPQIVFLRERQDAKNLYFDSEKYRFRRRSAEKRLNAMLGYCGETLTCRSQMISNYFGEQDLKRCGICDNCRKREQVALNDQEFQILKDNIRIQLSKSPLFLNELMENLEKYDSDDVLKVLKWLQEKEFVLLNKDYKLYWKKQIGLDFYD